MTAETNGVTRIVHVQITPTHDGEAALLITLGFPGGGRAKLQVGAEDAAEIMEHAGVDSAQALIGKPWAVLRFRETHWTPQADKPGEGDVAE